MDNKKEDFRPPQCGDNCALRAIIVTIVMLGAMIALKIFIG